MPLSLCPLPQVMGPGHLGFRAQFLSPLVPTATLSHPPLLTDIGVHASLRLRHQRPHQQHHDHPPGPEAAAQQIQGKFPPRAGLGGVVQGRRRGLRCPRGGKGDGGECAVSGGHWVRGPGVFDPVALVSQGMLLAKQLPSPQP